MNSLISKFIDGTILNNNNSNSNNVNNNNQNNQNNVNGNNNINNDVNKDINKPKLKYKHWCVQVEKKVNLIQSTLPTLESALSSNDEKKKEKSNSTLQKLNLQLSEFIALLELTSYKPSNKSFNDNNENNSNNSNSNNSLNGSGKISPPSSSSSSSNSQQSTSPSSSILSSTNQSVLSNSTEVVKENVSNSNTSSSTSSTNSNSVTLSTSPPKSPLPVTTMATIASSLNSQSGNQKNTRVITQSSRDSMILIWGSLLQFIEKFYKLDKDFTQIYICILLICKRKEFDSSTVSIDPITFKPWSKSSNDILSKYKEKLYKTYYFIAQSISNNNYLSIPLVTFCSKFLAVSYFRIPKVAKLIIEALTPPETEIKDIFSYFPTPQQLKHLNIIGERPDKSPFHSILMQIPDNFSLDTVGHGWVDNLARKEMTFFIFFKEWFTNAKNDGLDVKQVPGFYPLTYALLHELKTRDQVTPPISKPTPSMEAQYTLIQCCKNDNILDTMIKCIFLKTCVFDLAVVSSTLGLVEVWLKEYGTLPDSFDINFFSEGIESIITADHHQVLLRALQMIYNTSDCFQGNIRKVLFSDLLLHKYFYQLFLHWDQPVRNAYHHILLYRMVRIKRSILYASGFSLAEYSKLTHNNTTPVTKQSLSPAKYIEAKNNDHSYSSSSRLQQPSTSLMKPKSPRSNSFSNNEPKPIPSSVNNSQTTPISTSPTNNSNNSNTSKKTPPPLPPRNFMNSSSDQQNDDQQQDEDEGQENTIETPQSPQSPQSPQTPQSPQSPNTTSITTTSPTGRGKIIIPASLEKYSKDFALDIELFLEIEIYIKKVSDQFRQPELKHHESRLSHYVASSLSEFKTYIAHNNQVDVTPPKIIPLMFANSPLNLANVNPNFFRD